MQETKLGCSKPQSCWAAIADATSTNRLHLPQPRRTPPLLHSQARNRLIAVKAAQAAAAIRKKEGELSGSEDEAEERSVRGERRALQVSAPPEPRAYRTAAAQLTPMLD